MGGAHPDGICLPAGDHMRGTSWWNLPPLGGGMEGHEGHILVEFTSPGGMEGHMRGTSWWNLPLGGGGGTGGALPGGMCLPGGMGKMGYIGGHILVEFASLGKRRGHKESTSWWNLLARARVRGAHGGTHPGGIASRGKVGCTWGGQSWWN